MTRDGNHLASLKAPDANYASSTPTPTINTPSTSTSPPSAPRSRLPSPSQPTGNVARKLRSSPPPSSSDIPTEKSREPSWNPKEEVASDSELEDEDEEMADTRPPLHRPTDGKSQVPLLKDERGRPSYDGPTNGSARPAFAARRSTFRSRSPDMEGSAAVRKKYTYAGFFLLLSLVSFVIQTETAVYIQHELKWNKAYAML